MYSVSDRSTCADSAQYTVGVAHYLECGLFSIAGVEAL